jgi:dihydroorotate dehydrogenase (NAD+) catalytic subunit
VSSALELAPGLRLAHPVIVAAGGGGFGTELLEAAGDEAPAMLVTRSVTLGPDRGAAPPRMISLPDGLLHSIGTPNPGLEAVLRRHGPRWSSFDVPVVVSICSHDADDLASMARTLEMAPEVSGVELNLACADRPRGGQPICLDLEAAEAATVVVRAATDLPLIVKLSAIVPDLRPVARAVVAAGADALSATASWPALALDETRSGSALGAGSGWLSGPAVKHTGLRAVHELARVVKVPLIGVGGVATLEDVLDYLAVGASAVGLATAALADPTLPGRLGRALAAWCEERELQPAELVGRALPRRPQRSRRRGAALRR